MPMYCEDCRANVDPAVAAGGPCPECGGTKVGAVVSVRSVDTATMVGGISLKIGYSEQILWEQRWDTTTRLLVRLRQMYDSGQPINNTDMTAVIHSFIIECWHMWDTFEHDPNANVKLAELEAFEAAHPEIQIIRGCANTYKHVRRTAKSGYVARVAEFHLERSGCRADVLYYPIGQQSLAKTIDARELADQGYTAWQGFIASKGLTEQANIQDVLNGRL